MMKLIEVGAFSLLIGGQFLAALVSTSMRSSLYPPIEADRLAIPPASPSSEPIAGVSREHRAA